MTVLDHAPESSDVQHAVRLLHVQNCLHLGLRLLHPLLVEDSVQVVEQSGRLQLDGSVQSSATEFGTEFSRDTDNRNAEISIF